LNSLSQTLERFLTKHGQAIEESVRSSLTPAEYVAQKKRTVNASKGAKYTLGLTEIELQEHSGLTLPWKHYRTLSLMSKVGEIFVGPTDKEYHNEKVRGRLISSPPAGTCVAQASYNHALIAAFKK